MDLMEYQAKELFAKHGVPVTLGKTVETAADARAAAEEIGGTVVVKAQVKAGGRGKAGGVKLAKTPEEAEEHASNILGMEIKGLTVNRVLVVPAESIEEEYYFSFLLDRSNRSYLCIASVEGGVEIEEVAKTNPDAVKKIAIDAGTGVDEAKATAIVDEAAFPAPLRDQAISLVQKLWTVFVEEDATLVEVNPLARLAGDKLEALDGKVSLDDNAEFRHEDHAQFEDKDAADPLEAKAKAKGLNYVKLDGAVGIIGNGAGLVMSTLDVVAYAGEAHGGVTPANFLDIGGGANAQVMADGLDVILHDEQVKSVFVNVFGGITACDEVANGIVGALDILGDEATKPLVVRLDGNNVLEGRRDPRRGQPPARDAGGHHGRRGRQGRRAGQRLRRREDMSIYLNKDSRIIVQGMTGGMGSKHTTLMVEAGSNIVGGVNARKAGTSVELGGKELPVFGGRQGGDEGDRRRRLGRLRAPGLHQGRVHRGHRRRHRPARGDHRGRAGAGHRRGVGLPASARATTAGTRMIGPNCPGIITPGGVTGRHHPAHHRGQGPDRPGLEVGHADLPDDVRAEGPRLHHRDRHRR